MRRLFVLVVLILAANTAVADTSVDQLMKAKLSGNAKALNMFAGKLAKEGLPVRNVYDGNNIHASLTGKDVELINLEQEKIWRYKLNRKGKAKGCKVQTFDEMREQLKALEELPFFNGQPPADYDSAAEAPEAPGIEYEVTLDFIETDETETHAGLTGTVYKFTATAHRPGLSVDEGGGILKATLVVGPETKAWTDHVAWSKKWGAVIGEMTGFSKGLNNLLASNPALQEVMKNLKAKEAELAGTVLRVSTSLSIVPDPRVQEDAAASEDSGSGEIPSSLGDIGSKLGKSLFKKKQDAAPKGPRELYTSDMILTGLSEADDPLLVLPDKCPG